jgi:hypothetical protein
MKNVALLVLANLISLTQPRMLAKKLNLGVDAPHDIAAIADGITAAGCGSLARAWGRPAVPR